jgi:phosphohistidine phosphatase
MKQLLLMRHGASVRARGDLNDVDRPLTDRGKADVDRIGQVIAVEGLAPELVLSSVARRARQTALAVADACRYDRDITYLPELYDGGLDDILAVVRELPEYSSRVLVIGHSPAVDDAVSALGGTRKILPTAAVANLHLVVTEWQSVHPAGKGTIQNLWRPGELPRATPA